MEDPINADETIATIKEPVKTEELVRSSSAERSDDGSGSPPPNCSICLGKFVNTSFTDMCHHQFCFSCLLEWSKIKKECPLCKQVFKSIIYNVRSEMDYDQYYVPRELAPVLTAPAATLDVNFEFVRNASELGIRRFRTTMTGPSRRFRMLLNPNVTRPEAVSDLVQQVSREERRYRHQHPANYRRSVYRYGQWSAPLASAYERPLEHSAEYFRRNPCELDRLIPWINRDLQILLNANEPHIAYVLRAVMDALTNYDLRSAELRDTLRPYFGIHTDHFLHELMNFARTGVDVAAYDNFITYPNHGLPSGYLNSVQSPLLSSSSSSSHSDDSDVRVVQEVGRLNIEFPSVGVHSLDMPGPSTVSQAFQMPILNSVMTLRQSPDILTISSSSSSESDCEVVGYVKPRHERTPEIIELVSSDEENKENVSQIPDTPRSPSPEVIDPRPSTSQGLGKVTTTTTSRISRKRSLNPQQLSKKYIDDYDDDDDDDDVFLSQSSSYSDSDTGSNYSTKRKKKSYRKPLKKTVRSSRNSPKKPSTPKKKTTSQNTKKRYRVFSSSNENESSVKATSSRWRSPRKNVKSKLRKLDWSSSSDEDKSSQKNDENGKVSPVVIKVRKDLLNDEQHTEDSESTSSSSDSRRSSCSSSCSHSSDSYSENRRRKKTRSSRQTKSKKTKEMNDNKLKRKLKSAVVKCAAFSTVLKKNSNKEDEWYVEKKRTRKLSQSSNESGSESFETRLPMSFTEFKDRLPMCPDTTHSNNNDSYSLSINSDDNDEMAIRSNSQNSNRSDRTQSDKHKSKNRGKHKTELHDFDKPGTSQSSMASGSTSLSPYKHSEGKKKILKKKHKSHKKYKTSTRKKGSKAKRDKNYRFCSSSSSSN